MGRFLYYSRWHEEATRYYRDAAAFGELPLEPAYYQALTFIEVGRIGEALLITERLQRSVGSALPYLAGIAELYALCGAKDKARALTEQRTLLAPDSAYSSFRKAKLALALGESPLAMEFLHASFECKEPELPWLATDPGFDRVRDHELVSKLTKAIFPK